MFSFSDAYVGDSIFPALFLNTLTIKPHVTSILPNGPYTFRSNNRSLTVLLQVKG